MTQYDLYRDLARAIYALALDATEARDVERVAIVTSISQAGWKALYDELGGHTPILSIMEYLDPQSSSDDWWSFALENLQELKTVYPEVLG